MDQQADSQFSFEGAVEEGRGKAAISAAGSACGRFEFFFTPRVVAQISECGDVCYEKLWSSNYRVIGLCP
jgi:hypothetical protein